MRNYMRNHADCEKVADYFHEEAFKNTHYELVFAQSRKF